VNIFNPFIHNFGIFAYPLIPLGYNLLKLLALLLVVFEEFFMFLPQVLFFLSLITFPPLPFFFSLLCTMHNYLLELLGMLLLKFFDFGGSLFDR